MRNPIRRQGGDVATVFARYPLECVTTMQHGVQSTMVIHIFLVLHLLRTLMRDRPAPSKLDIFFQVVCVLRIVCNLWRMVYWFRLRQMFQRARQQATPELVALAIFKIHFRQSRVEKSVRMSYYVWLISVFAIRILLPRTLAETSPQLMPAMWQHCLLNAKLMLLHLIVCVVLFHRMRKWNLRRGIREDVLETCTTRLRYSSASPPPKGGTECSMCLLDYADGEELRRLGCGHCFHVACVDEWLVRHQNICPLCTAPVQPRDAYQASSAYLRRTQTMARPVANANGVV
mmetsp:Transcript_50091/g.119176  ORF Transcript_50091/g.119176 Transcript_50091/m.119176 type:complete len:288 (-) Transcript_50091:68-931(-)